MENVIDDVRHDGQSNITTWGSIIDLAVVTNGLTNGILRQGLRAARLKSEGGSILRAFLQVQI